MESSVSWKGNTDEEILMNFIHFGDLLMICESNSRIGFSSQICCLFQDDWKLVKFRRPGTCEVRESGNWRSSGDSEPAKFGSLETGEIQETWNLQSSGVWKLVKFRRPGTCEIQEFQGASIRELQWAVIFMNKASEVKEKPSQTRHLKSPGLKCELVASL
jgi:hypothetical protein